MADSAPVLETAKARPATSNGSTLQPPQSPKSVGFTEISSNGRLSADGRTVKSIDGPPMEPVIPIRSSRKQAIIPGMMKRKNTLDLDDYFSGPLDPAKHSRFPFFMRLHGSILPKLILPLLFVGGWTTAITIISKKVHSLAVDSLLMTVLGFVVGLALSFRSSSAYERYSEGRRFWSQLVLNSRSLAHIIWVHSRERPESEKEDILSKLSVINLIQAFAVACKHKLRHEIEYDYSDLKPLIEHLDTFAKRAHVTDRSATSHNRSLKRMGSWGQYLGISFLTENPQSSYKLAARAGKHHGNLPYEIINYIGAWLSMAAQGETDAQKMLYNPVMQGQFYSAFNQLLDAYSGCERVLQTPLPLAYNIAISQITWLYVLVLPFQLYPHLDWVTIPGTLVAAYIILGLAAIGREIEDPFGTDVNDLDLDKYCSSLQYDLNVLTSRPAQPKDVDWVADDFNMPLWPYSVSGYNAWKSRSMAEIRNALYDKVSHQAAAVSEGLYTKGQERVEDKTVPKGAV